jgi:hypothetical protein
VRARSVGGGAGWHTAFSRSLHPTALQSWWVSAVPGASLLKRPRSAQQQQHDPPRAETCQNLNGLRRPNWCELNLVFFRIVWFKNITKTI